MINRLNEYIDDLYEIIVDLSKTWIHSKESISESQLHCLMFNKYSFESAFYFHDAINCLISEKKIIRMSNGRMVWWENIRS